MARTRSMILALALALALPSAFAFKCYESDMVTALAGSSVKTGTFAATQEDGYNACESYKLDVELQYDKEKVAFTGTASEGRIDSCPGESTHKTEWAAVKAVFEAAGLKVNKWDYSDYKCCSTELCNSNGSFTVKYSGSNAAGFTAPALLTVLLSALGAFLLSRLL